MQALRKESTLEKPLELERHYTPEEIAQSWGVDITTVRRQFRDRKDVLKLKGPRGRVRLRIPASTLERVQREWSR